MSEHQSRHRLSSTIGLPPTVELPGYTRSGHGPGIVHLGLGAFHKAHQAAYTDEAIAAAGGDWRITGVSLRSTRACEELRPQNGLFTLIERGRDTSRARVIGSLADVLALKLHRQAVLDALTAPHTKIVSLTVTENGYGIDRATGGADKAHPAIAADLKNPMSPEGVAGLLVWALGQRRAAGHAPFTVLSCDNLPNNGEVIRTLLMDFAARAFPELVEYLATEVPFPSTMVDRITPAPTAATRALAEDLTGRRDQAAVETEAFRQWVIEDRFPSGRPEWEAAGAIFTDDVIPYEHMKLRMLNGTHSMLAYAGFLCGHETVRDVMGDQALVPLIRRHLKAAARTLDPVAAIRFEDYAADLLLRFENPNLKHATHQIATDGSQKMPQRIFDAATHAVDAGQPIDAFAFATACWLRYTTGVADDGHRYDVRDPRLPGHSTPGECMSGATADDLLVAAEHLSGVVPASLKQNPSWRDAVTSRLAKMLADGMPAAMEAERAAMRNET